MNIYHVLVLGIIAIAIGFPAYRYPDRGYWFHLGVGCLIAGALAILLVLALYLYLAAGGEVETYGLGR